MKVNVSWQKNLMATYFSSKVNSLISIVLLALLGLFAFKFFNWLVIDSIWQGDSTACREGSGACLAFFKSKGTYLLFGTYPREQLWRAILSSLLMIAVMLSGSLKSFWNWKFPFFYLVGVSFSYYLLAGGWGILPPISSHLFGGLPITLFLALVAFGFGFPLAIMLAVARRSHYVVFQKLATAIIELVRGVPLISLLFLSSLLLPLFLPQELSLPKLFRAQVVLIFFVAAYMAEVIRGGLQAIPKNQEEAAWSLGLSRLQTYALILIPQALSKVVVPLFNTAIGMFKDTSLVIIIALFDLMFTLKSSLSDVNWLGFALEAYLFGGLIYYLFCKYLSALGKKVNNHLTRN